jgi:hypothetical protein
MVMKMLLLILNIKRKKVTKLSSVVNKNGFIYSVTYFDIKNKNNKITSFIYMSCLMNNFENYSIQSIILIQRNKNIFLLSIYTFINFNNTNSKIFKNHL